MYDMCNILFQYIILIDTKEKVNVWSPWGTVHAPFIL